MFYTKEELKLIGFKLIGENVLISNKCSIYNPQNISIGNNVRIDDFVILSPSSEMIIGDFVGISGRVSIYSSSDDYTGLAMTNPMVPEKFKKVNNGDVVLGKHTIIGAGSVILPNVTLGNGCAVGALTLINRDCDEFTIYSGNPANKIGKRLKRFLKYEKDII